MTENRYYLIENRQPLGFDRVLPDSGLLVLKVDPNAPEGYGTAKIMNADKDGPHFTRSTFRLDRDNRNIFTDKEARVALVPLWGERETLGVLVTTPERSADALRAALAIQKLKGLLPGAIGKGDNPLIENCVTRFKELDFKRAYELAQKGLKN